MSVNSAVVVAIILSVILAATFLPSHSKSIALSKPFLNARDAVRDVAPPAAAPPCSFGGYNFSQINMSDWYGVDNFKTFGYYLRLCGPVSTSHCNSSYTRNSMVCQVQLNDSAMVYNIATNNPSQVAWSWWNGKDVTDGIKFVTNNGDMCGSMPRQVIGRLVCDKSSTGLISVAISDVWHSCSYNVTVPNPYVCPQ